MANNWRAVTGVLLVFVFGCLSGWLGASAVHERQIMVMLQRGPEGVATLWEYRMTRNLDLTADQRSRIHAYFLENLDRRRDLQKQLQPQMIELNRETIREIVAVLNPDQTRRFHQTIAELRRHYRQPFDARPYPASKTESAGAPQPAPGPAPAGESLPAQ